MAHLTNYSQKLNYKIHNSKINLYPKYKISEINSTTPTLCIKYKIILIFLVQANVQR